MTCAFCSRCIKCFLHLLFSSLMPTSPASRAVTDWDVSAVSIKQDHVLINHGSSNMPSSLTQARNSPRRLLCLPGASLAFRGIFQPITTCPSVIIATWGSSAQALATQPWGSSSSRGTGYVQPRVQLLPASLLFQAISAMHELSDKVKCAKTLQAPPATLIFIVSP